MEEHAQQVVVSGYSPIRRMAGVIYLFDVIVLALVAIDFLLRLLAANPASPFAAFIYTVAGPLVAPFATLFRQPVSDGHVFETGALIALIVYAVAGWILGQLLIIGFDRRVFVRRSETFGTGAGRTPTGRPV